MDKTKNLVWIDLEMTGLGPDKNRITEIACIITDQNLNVVSEKDSIIINQPRELFDDSDPMIVETFLQTDFINKVLSSKYDEASAEAEVLEYIKQYVDVNQSPLCGNPVYNDRAFLMKYMKNIDEYLHYRLIDVSTLRNLAKMWNPDILYKRNKTHRALDDIKESINELTHYRKFFLKA